MTMSLILAIVLIGGVFFLVYWLGRDIEPKEGGE